MLTEIREENSIIKLKALKCFHTCTQFLFGQKLTSMYFNVHVALQLKAAERVNRESIRTIVEVCRLRYSMQIVQM